MNNHIGRTYLQLDCF